MTWDMTFKGMGYHATAKAAAEAFAAPLGALLNTEKAEVFVSDGHDPWKGQSENVNADIWFVNHGRDYLFMIVVELSLGPSAHQHGYHVVSADRMCGQYKHQA